MKTKTRKTKRQTDAPRQPNSVDRLLAERVRAQRKSMGMSLHELGEALGLSQQQCQKYETGMNRISSGKLVAISEVFGVTPGSLIEGLAKQPRTDPEVLDLQHEAARLLMSIPKARDVETAVSMLRGLAAEPARKK